MSERTSIAPHSAASLLVVPKVATRLFSGQELSALRRDASFRRQMEEGLVMEVQRLNPSATTGGHAGGQHEGVEGRGGTATGGGSGGGGGGGGGPKGDPIAGGLKDRNPTEWSEVSWKSISLARKERDRRACGGAHGKGAPTLLDSGGSQKEDIGAGKGADCTVNGGGGAKEGRKRSLQETESSAMRQHARKREEEFLAGGAQNFYKPVRVCGSCFRVRG